MYKILSNSLLFITQLSGKQFYSCTSSNSAKKSAACLKQKKKKFGLSQNKSLKNNAIIQDATL